MSDGLHGRNFAWWMDPDSLDTAKQQIMDDPKALRVELVEVPEIGKTTAAKVWHARMG